MTAALAAALSFGVVACQTEGGGGAVIVDNEPKNLDQWVSWMNAKLVQACGYQASAQFLLTVFGKADFGSIIAQTCRVVEAARLAARSGPGRRSLNVVGHVAGVPFDPSVDGRFVR